MVTPERWLEAQAGVLGSVMIEPELAPKVVAETDAADYGGEYRSVYTALREMLADKQPIDALTVCNKLGAASEPLIRRLIEITPTAANVDAYIAACKEQSRLTALHDLGIALSGAASVDDAREQVSKAAALTVDARNSQISSAAQLIEGFWRRHEQGKPVEYLDWGIEAINANVCVGKGKYIIIGGYPSTGKSALMIQFARHMSAKRKVGIFSYETDCDTIADRLMSHAAGIDLRGIMRNDLQTTDWQRLTYTASKLYGATLDVIYASGMTASDIMAITLAKQYDVIMIDYVQLVTPQSSRRDMRSEEVAQISRQLQQLAKRHEVNVIALSQLSRPETNKKGEVPAPTLRSLRESGQLEQDADVVMLLYNTDSRDTKSARMLRIAKNKEGELGGILLHFSGATQTFRRATEDEIRRYRGLSMDAQRANGVGKLEPADADNPFKQLEITKEKTQ